MKRDYSKNINCISIVIPCFNESLTIEKMLEKISNENVFGIKKEIIVVNDGSTDKTKEILQKHAKKIKIVNFKKNNGKSFALQKGFEQSTGDIVIVQDADLEYDPKEYESLIKPILLDKADVVYGSRFIGEKPHRVLYYWHSLMNKFLTNFSNVLTNINLTDMETGYKVFRGEIIRELAPKIRSKGFGFEPEITAKISKNKKIRIYEVGISYYGRTYEEGKHINWKDGVRAVWYILKYNVLQK